MSKELQKSIEVLRSRLNEHQRIVAEWQARLIFLRTPPEIPSGATPTQIADILEAVVGRDDEILGIEAAITELQRRTVGLQTQLEHCRQQISIRQEQERRDQLKQTVIKAIEK